jgi:hypothetical protein
MTLAKHGNTTLAVDHELKRLKAAGARYHRH